MQMVDEDKIALTPAVELSFLKKDEQNDLLVTMESEDATPSLSQAQRMKRLSQQGRLDMDTIFEIMTEEKANQKETIKFSADRIKKYFPKTQHRSRWRTISSVFWNVNCRGKETVTADNIPFRQVNTER